MTGKRFYWIKLSENFFEQDAISWVEEQPNGIRYTNFYLKLCLKAMNTDGILIRHVGQMLVPYDVKRLAEMTRTDVDTVRVAMELFQRIGLIQILENGEIYLPELAGMVGSESKWAEKKRRQRQKKIMTADNIKRLPDNMRTTGGQCPIEKEKEIEIEKDIKTYRATSLPDSPRKAYTDEPLFQSFLPLWKMYPNKQDRKNAYKHYKAAIKEGATDEEIATGIKAYIAYVEHMRNNGFKDLKYKNGDTFFSKRSWESDFSIDQPQQQTTTEADLTEKDKTTLHTYIMDLIQKHTDETGKRDYESIYQGIMRLEGKRPAFTSTYLDQLYETYTA